MALEEARGMEALTRTGEVLPPLPRLLEEAYVRDWEASWRRSLEEPEAFWGEVARDFTWFEPWQRVLEWEYPYARWFVGGKTNIVYNALDRHLVDGRRQKVALFWEGEDGSRRVFTYAQLHRWVSRIANALKGQGVGRGDRVVIYMPLTPEGIATMLATARIGAIHSVVYAGLGWGALRQRVEDAGAKVVVCADVGYRRGRTVELKPIVDQALEGLDFVERVIVHRRRTPTAPLAPGEIDFDEMVAAASADCPAEPMEAEDPLFILYTSGTTGRPKGTVHVHGGYMVGTAYQAKAFYNIGDDDVFWSTSDIGWIVGHSYIVYAPLVVGATCLVREGAPDYPDPGTLYRLIEAYGVTRLFTAPTTLRMLMKYGEEWASRYDLSSLRHVTCAGEPLNPEAWRWAWKVLGGEGRAWIADNMWQTETGAPMVGSPLALPVKPGWCGRPLIGVDADVVDAEGRPLPAGTGGNFVVRRPWPSMFRTVWNQPERYEEYWRTIPGVYASGDLAQRDEEGYFMFLGRSDDVLNPAGHRIGTADVENALVSHPAVAEAAVIGIPDPVKGEAIKAFVILRAGAEPSEELRAALVAHVRDLLGPIATPAAVQIVEKLPKTRSGKIMRRLLKAQELGLEAGDTSTLEE
ncbi:MAG: acetate--CoA ligase [Clostridia bacterium]|nr:acetate--CoA ligase [Clostridia bacterium]